MPPIDNDGANMNAAMDEDQAVEAFLRQLDDAPKKEPSDKREETDTTTDEDAPEHEDADETDEHDAPSDDDGDEGEEEEDDKPARKYAEDEGIYVKIKVGDEEQEVAVKDLKSCSAKKRPSPNDPRKSRIAASRSTPKRLSTWLRHRHC
jgi:hypothetical protein